jgi:sorbitol/mannitol transport system permease protein
MSTVTKASVSVAEAKPRRLVRMPSFRVLLLMPALVYLVVMTQAPFILTLWYSFHTWILTSPELRQKWIGLDNYRYTITQDPIFRDAVVNTLVLTIGIVGISLVLGLGLALLLNRTFPLRGLSRSLLIAPIFVMPTVSAVVWKNLLMNPIFGLFSWIMTSVGLSRVDLLAQYPKQSIMAIAIWEWTPFMMLILLAGLQGIPDELREAARLDGATPLGEFRYVVLPLLGLYVELSIMLGTIYVLQIFGEIYVATQGGPGTATTTLPFYVFQTISQANDVGTSSAQGVVAVVVASIIAAILLRLLAKSVTKGVQA